MGLEYLDLYLVHFPIAQQFVPFEKEYPLAEAFVETGQTKMELDETCSYRETWEAMEELVKEGLVKNIGCCNMGTTMLRDVLSYAKVKPSVLQVELHPYNSQEKLIQFCREKGIAVTAFSSFGAAAYHEHGLATPEESTFENKTIVEIGKRHSKSPAQVLLRWGVQRGTAVIPKSTKVERQQENFAIFDFNLSNAEMDQINSLNKNRRFADVTMILDQYYGTFIPLYD